MVKIQIAHVISREDSYCDDRAISCLRCCKIMEGIVVSGDGRQFV